MVRISINYAGLSADLRPRVEQVLQTIVSDNNTRLLIDAHADTLNISFGHLGADKALGVTNNDTPNATIVFNLDRLTKNSSGEVVYSLGGGAEKHFLQTPFMK